ncbi:MAG: hypothetical protein PVF15_00910 [Candidatus Bathyarchaeota archaeon]
MLRKYSSIVIQIILFSLLLSVVYSNSVINNEYLEVTSAKVSNDRVEPFYPLTFSGKVSYSGTMIPPFSGNASLNFDGVDDFVVITDSQDFEISERITISLWVKTSRIGDFQRIMWKQGAFGLTINPSGKIYGTIWIDGSSQDSDSSIAYVANGSWHLCTYIYDGLEHRIYVDGTLESVKDHVGMMQTSADDLFIGIQEEGNLYPFEGAIDDVRIFDCSLSADEISGHFKGISENETGMVAHWSFDGDVSDKSGNGNYGVINGANWTNGWADLHVHLELNGLLKKTVSLINSTNGNFVFPQIESEFETGIYDYTIFVENGVQNKTITVTVEPPGSIEIVVLSPKNMTYGSSSIPLTFTVSKAVSWIGYSFDGNSVSTINGNTTLHDLSTGTHSIMIYASRFNVSTGSSGKIYFMVDTTPPTIVTVNRLPESGVTREQEVGVLVNATDIGSGVDEVVLSYTSNRGNSWKNLTMNYNPVTGMHEATIPRQPLGVFLQYKIVAYDKANGVTIDDNRGVYYAYTVVQEFPIINLLALFILLTLIVIIISTKKRSIVPTAENEKSSPK